MLPPPVPLPPVLLDEAEEEEELLSPDGVLRALMGIRSARVTV